MTRDVIVERRLHDGLSNSPILLQLERPFRTPRGYWTCAATLSGPITTTHTVNGGDSWQATELAMFVLLGHLRILHGHSLRVTWPGGGDYF